MWKNFFSYFHEIFAKNAYSALVWKLRNLTATIFSQKIREINFLLKNFNLSWFDEKKFCIAVNFSFFARCAVFERRNEQFFPVKSTFLLKKSLKSWFHGIFSLIAFDSKYFSTLCTWEIWFHDFFLIVCIYLLSILNYQPLYGPYLYFQWIFDQIEKYLFFYFRFVCGELKNQG